MAFGILSHYQKVRNRLVVNRSLNPNGMQTVKWKDKKPALLPKVILRRKALMTFAPVSSKDSVRVIMALTAYLDLELHQMDVKTAFLIGDIDEVIYMQQLENFVAGDPKKAVCKLKKSIYGLKKASCQWYHKFHQVITSFGFEVSYIEDCVYQRISGSKFVIFLLYVDDILIATNNVGMLRDTKKFRSEQFEMKDLSEASFILGIRIHQDRSRGILGLSQKSYIHKVLKRYDMKNCKSIDTLFLKVISSV